jgi:hypothetical protein
MVTDRPPEEVAGAMAPEVPTMVMVGVPLICTSPEEALTTVGVPLIWTRPDEAETNGMLKLGALDHGFVAAVAVTVGTDDRVTIPDDRLVGDDRVTIPDERLVADERVMSPDVTLTVRPPDVVTTAIPDEVNPPMATTSR